MRAAQTVHSSKTLLRHLSFHEVGAAHQGRRTLDPVEVFGSAGSAASTIAPERLGEFVGRLTRDELISLDAMLCLVLELDEQDQPRHRRGDHRHRMSEESWMISVRR